MALVGAVLLSGCQGFHDSYRSNSDTIKEIVDMQKWHELSFTPESVFSREKLAELKLDGMEIKPYISDIKQDNGVKKYWILTNILSDNVVLGQGLILNEVDCGNNANDKILKSLFKVDVTPFGGDVAIIIKVNEAYVNHAGYVNGSVYEKYGKRHDMSYFYSPIEQRKKMTKQQIEYQDNLRRDVCSMKL